MSEMIVQTSGLIRKIKGQNVLDGIDMKLERGRVYGLIGPSGSGKTELLRVMSGLNKMDGGTMELFGGTDEAAWRKARRRIGFVSDNPSCINALTAEQNLLSSMRLWEDRLRSGETWAEKAGYVPGKDGRRMWVWKVMELAGLPEQAERVRKLANYAPGPRRQFALAEALLGAPELLVADDIMEGTNLHGVGVMSQILQNLVDEYGVTLLLTGNGIRELYGIVTDYLYLEDGKILQTLTREELDAACMQHFTVTCANMEYAQRLLEELEPGGVTYEAVEVPEEEDDNKKGILHLHSRLLTEKEVRDRLVSCGIRDVNLQRTGMGLIEYYEKITARGTKA